MSQLVEDLLSRSKCGREIFRLGSAIVALDEVQSLAHLCLKDDRLTVDSHYSQLARVADLLSPTDDCVIVAIDQDWHLVPKVGDIRTCHGVDPRSEGLPR